MKKLLLCFLFAPYMLIAQTAKKGFVIDGRLEGYKDGITVKLVPNGESVELVSAVVKGGKFLLKSSLEEPKLCFLMIDNDKPLNIYVENTQQTLKIKKTEPEKFEMKGSASELVFATFVKKFMPFANDLNAQAGKINMTQPGTERDTLEKAYNRLQQKVQDEIDRFISDNKRSIVSAFVLNVTYNFNQDIMMLEKRFNRLDESIRKTQTGIDLNNFISDSKVGAIGTEALDFTMPDTTGIPVKLSSFRGKYVLVDFWASWCGPCRNENPNVVENFNKFKTKNFTILGVSLDKPGEKNNWVYAINQDNLTWNHVSDLKWWNNAAAKLYHIEAIPQNLLIDPDGKIVAKNLRGPALQAKLCEIFGCN